MEKNISRNNELNMYLDSLSDPEKRIASIKIRTACMIPRHKYYNWTHCKSSIEPLYCATIETALGCKIFNLDN